MKKKKFFSCSDSAHADQILFGMISSICLLVIRKSLFIWCSSPHRKVIRFPITSWRKKRIKPDITCGTNTKKTSIAAQWQHLDLDLFSASDIHGLNQWRGQEGTKDEFIDSLTISRYWMRSSMHNTIKRLLIIFIFTFVKIYIYSHVWL